MQSYYFAILASTANSPPALRSTRLYKGCPRLDLCGAMIARVKYGLSGRVALA